MGRKLKKRPKREKLTEEPTGSTEESTGIVEKLAGSVKESAESAKVPMANLPEKYLWMHVKDGTKIRKVLGYALKEFPNHDSVVWSGVGHGIGKTISCAELFKRKHVDLHQVTKIRYTTLEKSKDDAANKTHRVPEIHILLTKNIKDTSELGYQAPGDCGEFTEKENAIKSKTNTTEEESVNARATCIDTKQFVTTKLRIGQKRNNQNDKVEPFSKKNKTAN